ncbi:hypothetical protein CCAX7_20760 [Capsulimonas corticalis]|uniref:Uncharacterized protein n=1 Tax=Capsulimonas corticalis TaxID=2219043 RepID=A0A402D2F7_9BACT|nr:hypothetical protein [Capsulimonas corticalis]BDI30025.1 hypothetical protein CCAX7_20760 [Capsulimonas corticalis]
MSETNKIDEIVDFPVHFLSCEIGIIKPMNADKDLYNIEIPIVPFELDDERVKTSIRLDWIDFGDKTITELTNTAFIFPVNPEEGYIEGSIYLRSAHNPVDVTRIDFDNLTDNILAAALDMRILFEFEDIGFKNIDYTLNARLRIK